jgi:Fur family ferric uptake transcriptional regulator
MILVLNIKHRAGAMNKTRVKRLSDYLSGHGLRSTSQRDAIFKLFVDAKRHMSAEELYAIVKKEHPGIGYATVYRTLKLFSEAGLVNANRFEDGFTRFEYNNVEEHHDHLICTSCGAIIEFENERIEALQHDVARERGFKVQSHKLELYGLCAACNSSKMATHSKSPEKPKGWD